MSSIEVLGKQLSTDEEGYLENLTDWNADVATAMAELDGCNLTENHWEVINFLRDYYEEYEIAPAIRILTKAIGKKLGKEYGNSKYLYCLLYTSPSPRDATLSRMPSSA